MLTSAHIRNYRILRDLDISEFRRINVFTGDNRSGKTSLLEALFLMTHGANPNDLVSSPIFRELLFDPSTAAATQYTPWRLLFSGLDNSNNIEISAKDSAHGDMSLALYWDGSAITMSSSHQDSNAKFESSVYGQENQFSCIPYSSQFVSETRSNGSSLAEQFSTLAMEEQENSIIPALKLVEPNLRNIRNVSATGQAMLWADIGLDDLLPLVLLGNGMGWVAQMIVSLFTVRDGLLLIDRFESGIYHSLYAKVWKAIYDASVSANVQVIATTHNYECLCAICESIDLDEFRIHRLESTGELNRCVTYSPDAISGAMKHGIDVR